MVNDFIFVGTTKVQYYSDASDWLSCQLWNCSALPLACQLNCLSVLSTAEYLKEFVVSNVCIGICPLL